MAAARTQVGRKMDGRKMNGFIFLPSIFLPILLPLRQTLCSGSMVGEGKACFLEGRRCEVPMIRSFGVTMTACGIRDAASWQENGWQENEGLYLPAIHFPARLHAESEREDEVLRSDCKTV